MIVGIDVIWGRGCRANNERNASVSTSYLTDSITRRAELSYYSKPMLGNHHNPN